MDSSIFTEWFHNKVVPNCRKALKQEGLSERAILLMDKAPCHPDVDLLQSQDGNFICIYLPPNTTSLIQPGSRCNTEYQEPV